MTYEEYRAKFQQMYAAITFDELRKDTQEANNAIKAFWRFQDQHPEHNNRLLAENPLLVEDSIYI